MDESFVFLHKGKKDSVETRLISTNEVIVEQANPIQSPHPHLPHPRFQRLLLREPLAMTSLYISPSLVSLHYHIKDGIYLAVSSNHSLGYELADELFWMPTNANARCKRFHICNVNSVEVDEEGSRKGYSFILSRLHGVKVGRNQQGRWGPTTPIPISPPVPHPQIHHR